MLRSRSRESELEILERLDILPPTLQLCSIVYTAQTVRKTILSDAVVDE